MNELENILLLLEDFEDLIMIFRMLVKIHQWSQEQTNK